MSVMAIVCQHLGGAMNASVYTCMCKQQEEHAAGPTERVSTVESSALLIRHGGDLSVNRIFFAFIPCHSG